MGKREANRTDKIEIRGKLISQDFSYELISA